MGSITVVGTGIRQSHLTKETEAHILLADTVYYLVADKITELHIKSIRADAQTLQHCYVKGKDRLASYNEMIDLLIVGAKSGERVCAVFYGHPGVFVYPSHKAIAEAKKAGLTAVMLPSISAEDCLFADIGFDPASQGCVNFEATYFLLYEKNPDPTVGLILWQIGVIGERTHNPGLNSAPGLEMLADRLDGVYGGNYEVCVYEASPFAVCEARIEWVKIHELPRLAVGTVSTLFVPPIKAPPPKKEMLIALGLAER